MDADIREEFVAVRADLRTIDERVGGVETRLEGVETRLERVETRVGSVETRLEGVETRLERVETRVGEVDNRVREEGIATRRHFDVVAESLRDDIRIIAEGLMTLDAKVEAMRKI